MKKNSGNTEYKKNKISTKENYNDISEVEKLVDKIIQKNKEKIENLYENKNLNFNQFSLKNKKGDILFYLKKSSKKKQESEILNKKIISDNSSDLNEEQKNNYNILNKAKYDVDLKEKNQPIKENKVNKHFRFWKKEKDLPVPNDTTIVKKEDLLESADFEKVIEEIEKTIKIDVNKENTDETRQIEENIRKITIEEKNKDVESSNNNPKVNKLIEKHKIFEKSESFDDRHVENTLNNNESALKEISFEALKNKYGDAIQIVNEDKEVIKKDSNHNDEKIEVSPTNDETERIVPQNNIEEKKLFLRKDKIPDIKEIKQEVKSSDEPVIPRFRVENIPAKEDEDQAIINENIKNTQESENQYDGFKIGEEKAQILDNKQIKEKLKETPKIIPENVKNDISKYDTPVKALKTDPLSDHELVFFDEDEKFNGWSSHQPEKDRKELIIKPEIGEESQLGEIKDIELPKEVLDIKSIKLKDLGFSENDWEELDFYPLHEPFAYVEILREKETLEKCYFLVEVDLNEEENQTINFINDTINTLTIDTEELENIGNDDYLSNSINQLVEQYNLKIDTQSMDKIFYYLSKSSLGLGKIDPIMKDPDIEDISCDGSGVPLFLYHRKFGSLKSNIKFNSEEELSSFVYKLAQKCGKHISIAEPMLDATMPDGSRIQMTLSDEITTRGSTFTIRKFRSNPFSPPDLIESNTMNAEMIAYMWLAVENRINMLFAGGTASGKTTTLNALALFIPPESKIVSIEETREINLPHSNWIPGVARSGFGQVISDKTVGEIDMYDLMKAALRQRPEYILVGEIRGREAYVLFQAMATGHATYSTVHADSAQTLIHRLEGKPINIPRVMLQSLDVVSLHFITKVKNKRARRCKQIIEIIDIDPTTKEILTNEVFRWDPVEDKFVYSGKSYILERIRAEKDLSREGMIDELKKREKVIDLMNQNNIRAFRDVALLVSRYLDDPNQVLSQLDKEEK